MSVWFAAELNFEPRRLELHCVVDDDDGAGVSYGVATGFADCLPEDVHKRSYKTSNTVTVNLFSEEEKEGEKKKKKRKKRKSTYEA